MKRTEKNVLVDQLHNHFKEAKSAILLNYQGLNVAQITDLRNRLREASVDFQVLKNTLAMIASKKTNLEKIESHFIGPTAAAISKNDPVAGIKALNGFIKENPKLEIKVGLIDGTVVLKQDVNKFADMPSREQLLGMLLGTMQAPLATFVRMMAATPSALLNVLNGIKNSKPEEN